MSDIENQELSLADIAGLDISDVEELRSSQLPAGLFTFEVTGRDVEKVQVKAKDSEDEVTKVKVNIISKVIEVETIIDKDVEEKDVLGKSYTETFFIDPADAAKGFGYLKGWVKDIGGENDGPMGGVEGAEGFLDKLITHRYPAKIVKKKGRDGNFYARMQTIKAK